MYPADGRRPLPLLKPEEVGQVLRDKYDRWAKEGRPVVGKEELLRRERGVRRRLDKLRPRRGYPSPLDDLVVTHELLFAFGRELAELLSPTPTRRRTVTLDDVRRDIAKYLPDLPDDVVDAMAEEAMEPGHANTRVIRALTVMFERLLPAQKGIRSAGVHYSTVRGLVYPSGISHKKRRERRAREKHGYDHGPS